MPNIKTNKVHVFGWGKQVKIPKFIKAVQHYKEVPHVSDPRAEIKFKLAQFGLKDKIKPGMRIAVTAGSRGVDGMVDVIAQIIQEIKDCGGEPFVFPSMGSHGGATAEGQEKKNKPDEDWHDNDNLCLDDCIFCCHCCSDNLFSENKY